MPEASTLQRRRERQCASGQVVQPLLAVPGWLPAVAALPGHAGVRQAVVEVRGTADGGLRCSHDTAAHRRRVTRWTQRARTWRGEPATWRAASAIGCPADSSTGASQELKFRSRSSCPTWKDEGSTRRSLFDERDPGDRRSMRRAWEVLSSSLRFSRDFAVPLFYNSRIFIGFIFLRFFKILRSFLMSRNYPVYQRSWSPAIPQRKVPFFLVFI